MTKALDHTTFLKSLPPETRSTLTATQDAPGLWHLALHLGLTLILATWIAQGWALWPLALVAQGIALNALFMLHHECTHATPFENRRLSAIAGHLTGFLLLQPFQWFTAYHMAHHRHTNDPAHDPELAEPKPESKSAFLRYLVTPTYWTGKVKVLWANAFGACNAPYLSPRQHPRIRREARLMLAAYAALLALTPWIGALLFWVWLMPLVIGAPVLRLYLLAEHGRCPQVANMFDNTRTTITNRAVRWLTWNMPYHAEHHAWPQVPFHNLPKVHDLAQAHLRQISPSYSAFTADYVERLPAKTGTSR